MYPVGTKVVITWVNDCCLKSRIHLGDVVECRNSLTTSPTGNLCQETDVRSSWSKYGVHHPIAWMRALEDPDTSIMDDAEEIKRLADEIIS